MARTKKKTVTLSSGKEVKLWSTDIKKVNKFEYRRDLGVVQGSQIITVDGAFLHVLESPESLDGRFNLSEAQEADSE